MTEQRLRSCAEDCREALPMQREVCVADRVDTSVKAVQVSAACRSRHLALRIAQRPEQLLDRDHAVLPLRQLCEGSMCRFRPVASRSP